MAYNTLQAAEIESGDPVTQELFTKVKDNFIDHEARLNGLEAGIQTFFPIKFEIRGAASLYVPITGQDYERIFANITLTAARLLVPIAGTAGTWDLDVQMKRGAGAFSSIFSTRPSVAFGVGDFAVSSNAVLSTMALLVGDILRLDIQAAQTDGEMANLYLQFEVT